MNQVDRRNRLAAEIRAELGRQDISNSALAAESGIKKDTLRRRLKGESPFKLDEIAAVAVVLGIPLHDLYSRADALGVYVPASPGKPLERIVADGHVEFVIPLSHLRNSASGDVA